jgi:hypothetical protein
MCNFYWYRIIFINAELSSELVFVCEKLEIILCQHIVLTPNVRNCMRRIRFIFIWYRHWMLNYVQWQYCSLVWCDDSTWRSCWSENYIELCVKNVLSSLETRMDNDCLYAPRHISFIVNCHSCSRVNIRIIYKIMNLNSLCVENDIGTSIFGTLCTVFASAMYGQEQKRTHFA